MSHTTTIANSCDISNHWLPFLHYFKETSSSNFPRCWIRRYLPCPCWLTSSMKSMKLCCDLLMYSYAQKKSEMDIQDFDERSTNLSLFRSRRAFPSKTLISPHLTIWNNQLKELQQFSVSTSINLEAHSQVFFLSQLEICNLRVLDEIKKFEKCKEFDRS